MNCPLCHSGEYACGRGQELSCRACGNAWRRSRELESQTLADIAADRSARERRARVAGRRARYVERIVRERGDSPLGARGAVAVARRRRRAA